MPKRRLSASFAGTAVAAGAVVGTAIASDHPAGKPASASGLKPIRPNDRPALAAVNAPTSTPAFPGHDLALTAPSQRGADCRPRRPPMPDTASTSSSTASLVPRPRA